MKKINGTWLLLFVITGALLTLTCNCKKDENDPPGGLTTSAITRITDNSALSGGEITDEGSSAVIVRGVCWSTAPSPTYAGSKTEDGADTGSFVSSISGLQANTKYYVRAYASNSDAISYGNELSFTTPPAVTDFDGNVYHTVIIGTQVWMSENLKVTHYRNGEPIPDVIGDSEWANLTTGACCEKSAAWGDVYGKFYNGYAVLDSRNLAPTGWHIPSDAEWKILEGTVDSQFPVGDGEWDITSWRGSDAGGNLKAISNHWTGNVGATDESGFSALPGGAREPSNGWFSYETFNAVFWASTALNQLNTWGRSLACDYTTVERQSGNNAYGGSVRCVKD